MTMRKAEDDTLLPPDPPILAGVLTFELFNFEHFDATAFGFNDRGRTRIDVVALCGKYSEEYEEWAVEALNVRNGMFVEQLFEGVWKDAMRKGVKRVNLLTAAPVKDEDAVDSAKWGAEVVHRDVAGYFLDLDEDVEVAVLE